MAKKTIKKTVSKPVKAAKATSKYRVAPLSKEFTIISIVGIIISAFYMTRDVNWGLAFLIVFVIMFIASLRSMRYGPIGKI